MFRRGDRDTSLLCVGAAVVGDVEGLEAVKLRTVIEHKGHVLRKFLNATGRQWDKQFVL